MFLYKNTIPTSFNSSDLTDMQEVMDSFPFYVILVDENHNIVMVNNKVNILTGKNHDEIIGKYCPKVVHGIDHPFPGCPLEEALEKGCSIERELFDPNSKRWVLSCIYITNCITKDGLKIYLHIIQDITEKKEALEALKQSYNKAKEALFEIIGTLENIVETRDPYTAGHQKRVAKLAVAISQKLKFDKERINAISTAALIHDIGKIEIPTSILSKPTTLTDLEFSMIKTHSQTGYNLLKKIDFGYPVADIILQHHERLDGSGYPKGLKNDEILIEAKILAVADVVEAMMSHRPYRPALGINKALKEIETGKNKLYDPLVVETCLDLFYKEDFKF
ncbi:MAG: HD domain-containing protein [Firmicutes bacterium]|nr:HD domain-containing protein [Bacillota bacterium]